MQRAIDSDNITLSEHLLQIFHTPAANLFLNLRFERLIVEVQQFFAIKRFQSSKHTLSNSSDSNSAHNLVFEIIFTLGYGSDIPAATGNLLMGRNEVAHKNQDGHDDVLGNRHNVGACNLGDSDTTIRLIRSIEIDMIGSDTSRDRKLEILCFSKTFRGQVTGVKATVALELALDIFRIGDMSFCHSRWKLRFIDEGTYGVVMMTSASTKCLSKVEFSPSLSDVVTSS